MKDKENYTLQETVKIAEIYGRLADYENGLQLVREWQGGSPAYLREAISAINSYRKLPKSVRQQFRRFPEESLKDLEEICRYYLRASTRKRKR